jgi:hypothetical protein
VGLDVGVALGVGTPLGVGLALGVAVGLTVGLALGVGVGLTLASGPPPANCMLKLPVAELNP